MRIGLQDELGPQLHIGATCVLLVDEDRVVIVKLGRPREDGRAGGPGRGRGERERERHT